MAAVKVKADTIELEKAISQARLRKLKLDLHIKSLGLQQAEDAYTKKVEKVMRVWQRQWDAIAGAAGKTLYAAAQRGLAVKAWFEQEKFKGKSVYDIPDRYRRPIERAVSITPQTSGLVTATFLHLNDVYNRSAQGMSDAFGFKVAFRLRDRDILKSLSDRANYMAKTVSDTTFNRLKHRLATSYFVEGKHPTLRTIHPVTGAKLSSVAEDISGFFDGQVARAKTVARTETMAVQSDSEFEFNKRVGVKRHGWMTARDIIVRDSHRKNEGHEVELGKSFPNGQKRVGEGSAEDVVNCRCICRSSTVVTDKGNVQIRYLEEGNLVLTYKKGRVAFCRVKKVYNNGYCYDWIIIKTKPANQWNRYGYRVLQCTPEHKILQGNKYIRADKLKAGQCVVRPEVRLGQFAEKAILGTLIGDSVLRETSENGAFVHLMQGRRQKDYFLYKMKLFAGLGYKKYNHKVGNGKDAWVYESNTCVTGDYGRLIPLKKERGGQLRVTEELLHLMGPIGLAFWFMDDGTNSGMPIIAGDWDQNEEAEILSFAENMGWDTWIKHEKAGNRSWKTWRIRRAGEFWKYISPYIIPSLYYKVPQEYRNGKKVGSQEEPCWGFVDEVIIDVQRVRKGDIKMDLEVENCHNYCAGGMVIHNCSNYPVLSSKEHAGLVPWDGLKEMAPPPAEVPVGQARDIAMAEQSIMATGKRYGYNFRRVKLEGMGVEGANQFDSVLDGILASQPKGEKAAKGFHFKLRAVVSRDPKSILAMENNTMASCTVGGDELKFNIKYYGQGREAWHANVMAEQKAVNWLAGSTRKAQIEHEMGHVMFYSLTGRRRGNIKKYYEAHLKLRGAEGISYRLSRYAETSVDEFFAEVYTQKRAGEMSGWVEEMWKKELTGIIE